MTGRSSTVCSERFWKLTCELRSLGSSSISNLHSFPDQTPKPSSTEGGSPSITLIHPQNSARLPRIQQPQQASRYTPTFHLESNRYLPSPMAAASCQCWGRGCIRREVPKLGSWSQNQLWGYFALDSLSSVSQASAVHSCKSQHITFNPMSPVRLRVCVQGVLRPHPVFGSNRPLFGKCPVPRAGRDYLTLKEFTVVHRV
ncbi:uncharacterized protein [Vicugna pacos]|uniref:Uncharacterized protein isoform X1 n=1 Tax=Vicugna pacos TaxID=30538 RepID=A0ABM5CIV5_VICPA